MGGDLDHSDFVDPDYEPGRRTVATTAASPSASVAAIGSATPMTRPPSREEINQQVTATQQALVELKRRQEELERERVQLEEARRRRAEYEQGREEMLAHLLRGVGLLTEAEQTARRDAEQMARTLTDLRGAYEKVSALQESTWNADNYSTELTRALTTLESARMEWNSAQLKWPLLSGQEPVAGTGGSTRPTAGGPALVAGKTPAELARLGLALTWPVAVAILFIGAVIAVVLARA